MPAVLSPVRPFVLSVQYQTLSFCGIGLCDPALSASINAATPFVYDTSFHTWELAATGDSPANTAGDDLLHNPQVITFLTAGIGQTDAQSNVWYPKTTSETNLFKDGSPVERPFMFLAMGITVHVPDPFQRGGDGSSAADPKYYSAWLQESEDGPGYSFLMQKFHINNDAFLIRFSSQGCDYRLGLAGHSPPWGFPRGAQTVMNGNTTTPGMYLPFTTAICLGSRDDVKTATFVASTGHAGRIQNNAPVQTDLPPDNLDGTVYVPILLTVVGMMICVPLQDYCGVPSVGDINVMRAQLGMTPQVPG